MFAAIMPIKSPLMIARITTGMRPQTRPIGVVSGIEGRPFLIFLSGSSIVTIGYGRTTLNNPPSSSVETKPSRA
jgi:hypothetical protein